MGGSGPAKNTLDARAISRRHDDAAPGGARVEPPRVGSQAGHEDTRSTTTRPRVVVSAERFPGGVGGGDKEPPAPHPGAEVA